MSSKGDDERIPFKRSTKPIIRAATIAVITEVANKGMELLPAGYASHQVSSLATMTAVAPAMTMATIASGARKANLSPDESVGLVRDNSEAAE